MTHRHLTPDEVDDVCTLYRAGYGMPAIAERYGVTVQTVRYWLMKQNVPSRPRGHRSPATQWKVDEMWRERKALVAVDTQKRRHQTCEECGAGYSNTRRYTVLCGRERCRQQRDYKKRMADPVRRAKFAVNQHDAYMRNTYGTVSP